MKTTLERVERLRQELADAEAELAAEVAAFEADQTRRASMSCSGCGEALRNRRPDLTFAVSGLDGDATQRIKGRRQ